MAQIHLGSQSAKAFRESGYLPAVARSLQADGACEEVGGPTPVWEPAAHTKESAGERSLPISLIYPRQLTEQGTSEYHYTSTTSTSGSWPSVVEKRIFGALSVRRVDKDLCAACGLSEIAQLLYGALPNVVVARQAHWPEPGPVECRKPVLCAILQTNVGEDPFHALGRIVMF